MKKKREEKWRLIYNQPIGPMAQPVQSCKLQFDIMRRILDCVSKVCGISVEKITGMSRKHEDVQARQIFCFLARRYTDASWSRIGNFVNRDHTTALVSVLSAQKKYARHRPIVDQVIACVGLVEFRGERR